MKTQIINIKGQSQLLENHSFREYLITYENVIYDT